jgi:putative acetyltransferase
MHLGPFGLNRLPNLHLELFLGQIPPEATLIDELRAGPAWLPALSLVAVTPAGEVIGHVLGTRGHVGQDPVLALGPLAVRPDRQWHGVGSGYLPRLRGMFTYPEPFDRT